MSRLLRLLSRHAFLAIFALLIASCGGGGCSGCSSCGSKPLAAGFPTSSAITNAASIRLTRPGLDFMGQNIGTIARGALGGGTAGGVASFQIPSSSSSGVQICPDISTGVPQKPPQCTADVDLGKANLHIDSITPHSVKITGTLPVRVRDLPATVPLLGAVGIVVGDDGCSQRGQATFQYHAFPVHVELPLIADTRVPRAGYTKVDVDNAIIDVTMVSSDVQLCSTGCGLLGSICDAGLAAVKDLAFNMLVSSLKGQLKKSLQGPLCTKPTPGGTPPCPIGSVANNGDPTLATECDFPNGGGCVPSLLGTDGHMDLSTALASFSPGTQGGLDFVFASAGDMNPAPGAAQDDAGQTPNGVSLGFFGGALPQPETTCAPIAPNPVPQGIPVPDELIRDQQTPWPPGEIGPHLGVAIAGRFLSFAFTSVYNSGLLCLGISTEQVAQLNSGYLSLLAGSLKTLAFEQKPAAAAIATRPQVAPVVKLGGGTDIKTDPLLTIFLQKFSVDFYVFSIDRFVRAFTLTADITVPVNLQTGKDPVKNPNGGILPVLGDLTVANAVVTNNDLVTDDPAIIAGALSGLLGGLVGQFVGSGLKPIDVSTALKSAGLGLTIPQGGIRKLTKGSDDFLAIFANLTLAPGAARLEVDTTARLLGKTVHPEAMSLTTATRDKFPTLHVAFSSTPAPRPVEYSWWIDEGTRSAWGGTTDVVVDSDAMILQGKHTLSVSARMVGDIDSEDSTPATVPFVIDVLPPNVILERTPGGVVVHAWDFVSSEAALVGRVRLTDARGNAGEFSAWKPIGDLGAIGGASSVDVEVKDEEGNVASVSEPLIRGRADATLSAAGSGCGCRMTRESGQTAGGLALAGIAALLVRRHRRRRPARHRVGAP